MPANELHFSYDFKDTLTYCKEDKLFLGSGNPNADILVSWDINQSIIIYLWE